MKLSKIAAALAVSAAALSSTSAMALDMNGKTTSTDAACAMDPVCALARGGVSDVMTVYRADHTVYDRIFAFGNEEAGNLYYFDPLSVSVNDSQLGNYRTLLEPDGVTWSDTYGVIGVPGVSGNVLAFISDLNSYPPIQNASVEVAGYAPWVLEPGERAFTIEYDATMFLSDAMRQDGFTATFQSDVPEPASMALLGLAGLAGAFARRRKV
ncbi:MAG: PEP-CTERM sorting domain-containing protein [Rhodocyclaceae bacterium]|nr:PEP-CTERM sorting domain-containing protein [Rhodocyclaceae bacterium]